MGKSGKMASKSSKLRHVVRAVRRKKTPTTQRVRLLQDMEGLARSIKEMRLTKYKFEQEQPRVNEEEKGGLALEVEVDPKPLTIDAQSSVHEGTAEVRLASAKTTERGGKQAVTSPHHKYLQSSENGRRLLSAMTESEHVLKKNMLTDREQEAAPSFETKEKGELTQLEQTELERQKHQLHVLNREYNTAKVAVARQEEVHAKLKFTLYDLQEKEEKVTLLTWGRDKIEDFEAHKTMTEEYDHMAKDLERYNKYEKTLGLMRRRLNQYKLIYDAQVVDMRAKVKDCARALKLQELDLQKAEASQNKTMQDLDETGARCEADLLEWKDKLQSRKEQVANLNKILKFREDQIHKSRKIIASVKGDLNEEGEQKLQRKVLLTKAKQRQLQQDLSSCSEKVDEYETAFRRIINSTGINDTTEVVNKYITQEATKNHLSSMVSDANTRIRDLTKEKQHIAAELERLRFSGLGSYNKHRKLLDDREESIAVLKRQVDHVQSKSNAMSETVSNLKTVTDKLIHLLNEVNLRDVTNASAAGVAITQETTLTNGPFPLELKTGDDFVEALRSCEHKIRRILSVLPRNIEALHDLDETVLESYMRSQIKVKRLDENEEEPEEDLEKPPTPQPEMKRKKRQRKPNGKRKLKIDVEAKRTASIIDPVIDPPVDPQEHSPSHHHSHRRPTSLNESPLKLADTAQPDAHDQKEEMVIAEDEGRQLLKEESFKLMKFAEKKRKKLRKLIETGGAAGNKRLQSLLHASDKEEAIESYIAALVCSEAQRSPIYSYKSRHRHRHNPPPVDEEADPETQGNEKDSAHVSPTPVLVESAEAQLEL